MYHRIKVDVGILFLYFLQPLYQLIASFYIISLCHPLKHKIEIFFLFCLLYAFGVK